MFIRSLNFLLLVLATTGLLSCNNQKAITIPSASIDSLMQTVPDFSGVVLVESAGKIGYHKAFGYRDYNTKVANDTTTLFELASISKQFTAMAIMMLAEEGKITYDQQVTDFFIDFPYKGITIRHLLQHTSGLPDYQQIMDEHWDKSLVAGNREIFNYLKQYHPPMLFQPGERYEYSNTGYVVLGSIAELASGKDFVQLCRDRIFKPLGMNDTDIRSNDVKATIQNFAMGHIYVPEKQQYIRADSFPSSNYIFWLGNRKGPGRISSTARDLVRWDRALAANTLVRKETMEQAYTPGILNDKKTTSYGFGWEIRQDSAKGKVVWHTGSNPGYSNVIVRYLDVPVTIIMLSNNAYPKFKELAATMEKLVAH